MGVCKSLDEFIEEKPIWFVELSNGETIYQDDNREGESEPIAWIRLRQYVQSNNLNITRFFVKFYTHIEEVAPANASGYYFVNRIDAFAFAGQDIDYTSRYYVIGYLGDEDTVHTKTWGIPEIVAWESDDRVVDPNDLSLITNG